MTADRPRVLLVDDIDDNLCALEAILRPLGLILVRASSGEEAMKALLRDDFALILLDVVMPGLDGFATAARIKRLDQTRDVPIIFLSAFGRTPEYAVLSRVVGASDYPDQAVRPLGAAREGGDVHRAQPAARRPLAVSRRAPARLRGNPGRP